MTLTIEYPAIPDNYLLEGSRNEDQQTKDLTLSLKRKETAHNLGLNENLRTLSKVVRYVISIFCDLALLPIAGVLTLISCVEPNLIDPKEESIKTNKTAILLLHGSGFNQSEWLVGKHYLQKETYGSVFALNYAGLISNKKTTGVDDYAKGKVSQKIEEIKEKTGTNKVILIGHSLGGMIATYYAENLAESKGTQVDNVITIGSPLAGSPTLDICTWKKAKRYGHMRIKNEFRKKMYEKANQSNQNGVRRYHTIGSDVDIAVPSPSCHLKNNQQRQKTFSFLGHYGLVAAPPVWSQVSSWLDQAYQS